MLFPSKEIEDTPGMAHMKQLEAQRKRLQNQIKEERRRMSSKRKEGTGELCNVDSLVRQPCQVIAHHRQRRSQGRNRVPDYDLW